MRRRWDVTEQGTPSTPKSLAASAAAGVTYKRAKVLSLKAHPALNERWLQQLIADDPGLLGLGEVVVKDIERRQPRAGRLDMLLSDPETNTRYEVELQLGATDETHIIRTIEYWDIERRRYPQYDHVAVIVAEDITSRFLNVIGLFNGFIPLVAIQVQALDIDGVLTFAATKVVDVTSLGMDEEEDAEAAPTDRAYWENRVGGKMMHLVDEFVALIREHVDPAIAAKYTKYYVGLARNGLPDNFVFFRVQKQGVIALFKVPRAEELSSRLEDAGVETMSYDTRHGNYRIRVSDLAELTTHRDLFVDLITRASRRSAD
jgi:hypothetical protein